MMAPPHDASFGPYKLKVTVPPATGFTRPLTVALSDNVPAPSTIGAEALVVIDVGAAATVVCVVPMPPPVKLMFGLPTVMSVT